ncbi:MAG: polyprenol monophosphomannose synthase [Anaerolineales bacterium]
MDHYLASPWVVIPTYNEAGNVRPLSAALMALHVPDLHLLFVDDASPDGTGQLLDDLAEQYAPHLSVIHRTGLRGLGRAYVTGFQHVLEAGATAIVQMDCDFSHQPQDVPRLLASLQDVDLVIGSRYVEGGSVDPNWGFNRKALSSWANFYSRIILGLREPADTTAGFRAWKRQTLGGLDLDRIQSQGYVFQVEMTYVASRLGYRIKEIPIFFPDRQVGESKMTIPVKLEAALRVWEVRWRHRGLTSEDRHDAGENDTP